MSYVNAFGNSLRTVVARESRRRLPQVDGRVLLPGLRKPVSVFRDSWGIPTIRAADRHDLFFAQGFVHAQDRLWQMELNRRAANGELSELLGPTTLDTDRFTRTLGFARLARKSWENLEDKVRTDLLAYTRGINAFLESGFPIPLELALLRHRPRPWTPEDSLAYGRLQMWALTHGAMGELVLAQLIEQLGPETTEKLRIHYPGDHPITLAEGVDFQKVRLDPMARVGGNTLSGKGSLDGAGRGSNAWVIAAGRSTTGHAILCNDMHLPLTTPSLWYYVHLRSDDGLHVTGFSQPGLPYVLQGHNNHIGWAATLSYADCEDLFVERLHPGAPSRYLWQGEWRDAEVYRETIAVRGRSDYLETVIVTHHGPIISEVIPVHAEAIALSSIALKVDASFDGFALLNEAANWDDFVLAVSRIESPALNLLYADHKDNIGYYLSGKVPVRLSGNGTVPVPGWTGEYEWVDSIPFEEMPQEFNPRRGYIVTANNRIVGDDYPHFLGEQWRAGYRAARIERLINGRKKVSLADCQSFQMDLYSIPGIELRALLSGHQPIDEDAAVALGILRRWDGWLGKDSVGGAVYELLLSELADAVLTQKVGRDLRRRILGQGPHPLLAPVSEFHGYWPTTINGLLKEGEQDWLPGFSDLIEKCLAQTTRKLRKLLGSDPEGWLWGRLHQVRFPHPFGLIRPLDQVFSHGPFPVGGDAHTLAQASLNHDASLGGNAISVSSRAIMDMGNLEDSWAMHAPGQSGHLGSPHYGDMIQPWLMGEYYRMAWCSVDDHASHGHLLQLRPVNQDR